MGFEGRQQPGAIPRGNCLSHQAQARGEKTRGPHGHPRGGSKMNERGGKQEGTRSLERKGGAETTTHGAVARGTPKGVWPAHSTHPYTDSGWASTGPPIAASGVAGAFSVVACVPGVVSRMGSCMSTRHSITGTTARQADGRAGRGGGVPVPPLYFGLGLCSHKKKK